MAEMLQVEAARIPDRDRLLELLIEHGLDARPVDEVEIEVPCGDARGRECDELLGEVERLVMDIGAPFVPLKHADRIYIRPPIA